MAGRCLGGLGPQPAPGCTKPANHPPYTCPAPRPSRKETAPGFGFWMGFTGDDFVGWWILRPPHGPDQPKIEGEAELGYRLLRRHWRQGYATEGARELIRYGFEELGLNRIFAQTMAVNTPSRATMASAGMTFARTFSSAEEYEVVLPGTEHGEVEYAITRRQWQETRG
ncbi:GNAT family N-acetyltransferase [Amycolatopsis sp. NPDC049688]|uniref:GNAT family N-acetyltransferase n=1 Tax=Amycolatopsis sp. NPDC049688 TaxID=3154733 RepID=UPI00343A6098